MSFDVAAIIQARNGSVRLPGKVMRQINGRPMISYVVERVRTAKLLDDVIVATTSDPIDDAMAVFLTGRGVKVFRGSPLDVLDRYYRAALQFGLKNIVRITADCPLMDGAMIDRVVGKFLEGGYDYGCNVLERTFPDGLDVEVISFQALKRAWQDAQEAREREHVTIYIRNHPEIFPAFNIRCAQDWGKRRWTLDYEEDFLLAEAVLKHFAKDLRTFCMEDVAKFLDEHPEIETLNRKYVKY